MTIDEMLEALRFQYLDREGKVYSDDQILERLARKALKEGEARGGIDINVAVAPPKILLSDAWLDPIAEYVKGEREISSTYEIADKALGIPLDRVTRADRLRIASILKTLGFESRSQFDSDVGGPRQVWAVKPGTAADPIMTFAKYIVGSFAAGKVAAPTKTGSFVKSALRVVAQTWVTGKGLGVSAARNLQEFLDALKDPELREVFNRAGMTLQQRRAATTGRAPAADNTSSAAPAKTATNVRVFRGTKAPKPSRAEMDAAARSAQWAERVRTGPMIAGKPTRTRPLSTRTPS